MVSVFELNKNAKGVLLGTDGLWDELGNQEIARLFSQTQNHSKFLSSVAFECLQSAAKRAGVSLKELQQKSGSERRNFHDDISLLYIDLRDQVSQN